MFSKVLEADVGNSRIKWRLREIGGDILASGVATEVSQLVADPALVDPPEQMFVCSVRPGPAVQELTSWFDGLGGEAARLAAVQRQRAGVTVYYDDLSRLGVDRWLAILAGFRRCAGAVVVVDAGTALTVDVVDTQGEHRGGYIVPGLQLARDSLERATAIRLTAGPGARLRSLGHSTDAAVKQGTLASLVALVEQVMHMPPTQTQPRLILTGGDAAELAALLEQSFPQLEVNPDLVLDGLSLALEPGFEATLAND